MEVRFDCKIRPEDMFRFNMYVAYRSFQGWSSILFGALGVSAGIMSFGRLETFYPVAYIVVGILFFLYLPVTFKLSSRKVEDPANVLSGTLHYTLSGEGVRVETDLLTEGENVALLPWNQVYKVQTTKDMLMIFSGMKNAYILPKEQLSGKTDAIKEVLIKNLPNHRLSYKW